MRAVIRLGGSVVASPPSTELLNKYASVILSMKDEGHELVVIVGGGSLAREFIKIARNLGLREQEQDEIAISVSRLYAQLLAIKLGGHGWRSIPTSVEEAAALFRERGLVVMGGLKPGMTTDTVAVLVASETAAEMIFKATDQEGIYTKDPRKQNDAKKLNEISIDDLYSLLEQEKHKAGIHQIIDPEAVRILREKRLMMIVANGFKPENLVAALNRKKVGTLVK